MQNGALAFLSSNYQVVKCFGLSAVPWDPRSGRHPLRALATTTLSSLSLPVSPLDFPGFHWGHWWSQWTSGAAEYERVGASPLNLFVLEAGGGGPWGLLCTCLAVPACLIRVPYLRCVSSSSLGDASPNVCSQIPGFQDSSCPSGQAIKHCPVVSIHAAVWSAA